MAAAWGRAGRVLRVAVTAFTHAALENLLGELVDLAQDLAPALGLADLQVRKIGAISTPRGESLIAVAAEQVRGLAGEGGLVVGGTVYALGKAIAKGAAPFDVLVVDEASQLRLGELALGSVALCPGGRLLLAGDHHQLSAHRAGAVPRGSGRPGRAGELCVRLLKERDSEPPVYTCQLTDNWRMNTTLSRLPALTLYGERYLPATAEIAARTLMLSEYSGGADPVSWLLDPQWPLTVAILEDTRASAENLLEATLVARLALTLRAALVVPGETGPFPDTQSGDREFFRRGLFIVSPHHAQIRAIRREIERRRVFRSAPFIGTVDKMQGQQCEVVLVSYGVSDPETALREGDFIYSRNRLNVSLTRARSKCVVFLPRALLEPYFEVLDSCKAAEGLGHMHALLAFCQEHGQEQRFRIRSTQRGDLGAMTALRCRYP